MLYAKGMTTGDIVKHMEDVYGTDVSRDLVSTVTDAVVAEMAEWQSRPLDAIYPVILIDAIVLKDRDRQVANRPVYVAIGIDLDGQREGVGFGDISPRLQQQDVQPSVGQFLDDCAPAGPEPTKMTSSRLSRKFMKCLSSPRHIRRRMR